LGDSLESLAAAQLHARGQGASGSLNKHSARHMITSETGFKAVTQNEKIQRGTKARRWDSSMAKSRFIDSSRSKYSGLSKQRMRGKKQTPST
jgi:hypothetical protein